MSMRGTTRENLGHERQRGAQARIEKQTITDKQTKTQIKQQTITKKYRKTMIVQ